jgi:hypothetical protein
MIEPTHRDMAVRGLIRVLIGVGTGAGVMAVAIAWREAIHRASELSQQGPENE